MDSLCVPGGRADLRRHAIKLMAQTYRDAAKVLVIDEGTRSLCGPGVTWQDALFRICTSGWSRRIWTLQEGLLARELYFEFKHGPVDIEETFGIKKHRPFLLGNTPSTVHEPTPVHPMAAACTPSISPQLSVQRSGLCGSYAPLLGFRAKSWQSSRVFRDVPLDEVIALLAMRRTSKAEDETVAIAGLLPLDIEALLGINGPDAAQQECLLRLRTIPRSLVMETSNRLDLPGFSWAPRSLTMVIGAVNTGTGLCTEECFLAEFAVLSFEQPIPVPPRKSSTSPSANYSLAFLYRRGQPLKAYAMRICLAANNGPAEFCDALLLL